MLGRDGDRGLGEHRIGEDRTADTPERLEREVGGSVLPLEAAEPSVDKGDDRVEVTTRFGPNIKMIAKKARRHVRRRVPRRAGARRRPGEDLRGDARTDDDVAARKALPKNSASKRRHKTVSLTAVPSPDLCVVTQHAGRRARLW